jgi:hypothetical protein
VIPEDLPEFAILIRWGKFRLDLVGRHQIALAAILLAMVIGVRLLVL